jgi:hypothetical protein
MKSRKGRETGGVNLAAEDLAKKNQRYTYQSKVNDEAEERKAGGRTKRKHGGEVHRSGCKCAKCEGGSVDGEKSKMRADRKPRKSGGATANPFSSARTGINPPGHKSEIMD